MMPKYMKTASCCVLAAKVFGSIADNVQSLHMIQSRAGKLVPKLISSTQLSELNLDSGPGKWLIPLTCLT